MGCVWRGWDEQCVRTECWGVSTLLLTRCILCCPGKASQAGTGCWSQRAQSPRVSSTLPRTMLKTPHRVCVCEMGDGGRQWGVSSPLMPPLQPIKLLALAHSLSWHSKAAQATPHPTPIHSNPRLQRTCQSNSRRLVGYYRFCAMLWKPKHGTHNHAPPAG